MFPSTPTIRAGSPRFFAELLGGRALPFPAVIDGSWVALAGDERGTMIEIYPRGTELHAGRRRGTARTGVAGRAAPPQRDAHGDRHRTGPRPRSARSRRAKAGPPNIACAAAAFGVIELCGRGLPDGRGADRRRCSAEYLDAITIENWETMLGMRSDSRRGASDGNRHSLALMRVIGSSGLRSRRPSSGSG